MEIHRAGSRPSITPDPDYFTGRVRMDPIAGEKDDSPAKALLVTFEPGARTAWHTHPAGQTLQIVSGLCLAQSEGGRVRELRPGDSVWFAPGEKHWHGAAPEIGMCHLAIQTAVDGKTADWMEKVSDADYGEERDA